MPERSANFPGPDTEMRFCIMDKNITVTTKSGTPVTITSEFSEAPISCNTRVKFTHPVIGDHESRVYPRKISRNGKLLGLSAGVRNINGQDQEIFLAFNELEITIIETHFTQLAETIENIKTAKLEAKIADGNAFRVAEIAAQYDAELLWASRFSEEEKAQFADWFKDFGMGSLDGPRIKVEKAAIRQVVGDRPADGAFRGCENQAWIITEAEWNQIIALSQEIEAEKEIAREKYEEAEAVDLQRKIETGYCFSCESWCYGDCGNYQTSPAIKFRRDLDQTITEQNYGIND